MHLVADPSFWVLSCVPCWRIAILAVLIVVVFTKPCSTNKIVSAKRLVSARFTGTTDRYVFTEASRKLVQHSLSGFVEAFKRFSTSGAEVELDKHIEGDWVLCAEYQHMVGKQKVVTRCLPETWFALYKFYLDKFIDIPNMFMAKIERRFQDAKCELVSMCKDDLTFENKEELLFDLNQKRFYDM